MGPRIQNLAPTPLSLDALTRRSAFLPFSTRLQVLTEIAGDASLDKFRAEYEKLHGALVNSHDSEKRLVAKCRDLNAEIVANAAKVQTR